MKKRMAESVVTAKLRLREPTENKKQKLFKAMEQVKEVANRASIRLSDLSINQLKNKRGGDNLVSRWVKKFKSDGIDLPFSYTQLAIEQAFTNYLNNLEDKAKELERKRGKKFREYNEDFKLKIAKNYQNPPKFKNEFLKIRGKDIRIHKPKEKGNKGNYYGLVIYPFPWEKIGIPFLKGDYQDYFLKRIEEGEATPTNAEIVKYDDHWSLNLHIKKEVDIDYEPETFIGIDLGLNTIAWAVVLDEEGNFLDETHFDGSRAGHIRRRYDKLRRKLQKKGLIEKVKEIGSREKRWMEDLNHNISSDIIEFTSKFKKPIIVLEDITSRKIREETKNPNIHSWTHGELRDFIEYKAKEEGIKTKLINPAYTSQKCPECGYTDEANRNGIKFKCKKCGYENHSDFVGAMNIGLREIK